MHLQRKASQMTLEQTSAELHVFPALDEHAAASSAYSDTQKSKASPSASTGRPHVTAVTQSVIAQRVDPVLGIERLECLHRRLNDQEEEDGRHVVPLLDPDSGIDDERPPQSPRGTPHPPAST